MRLIQSDREPENALQWYMSPEGGMVIECSQKPGIFEFVYRQRKFSPFTVAMCIPTGVGARPGGDAGDAGPIVAAMPCDRIIVNPNVVNGSDLTALPTHGLYVEGYSFSRFLMGTIALRPVRQNRIVLYAESDDMEAFDLVRHAAAAANNTCGFNVLTRAVDPLGLKGGRDPSCPEFDAPLVFDEFDAIAVASRVEIPEEDIEAYYRGHARNPWGVAEAMLSHFVSATTGKPCAHAPMDCQDPFPPVGPMSSEAISRTWLHSVLHGLNRAPLIVERKSEAPGDIDAGDIDVLCLPERCYGLQVRGALKQGIPIIYVKDESCTMKQHSGQGIAKHVACNWTECLGLVAAMRAGVSLW